MRRLASLIYIAFISKKKHDTGYAMSERDDEAPKPDRAYPALCIQFQVNAHFVVLSEGWWAWPILCFLASFGRYFLFPGISVHILNCFKSENI
jgi:hypothetical protein